jgi:D-aspartate ligase
MLDSIGFDRTVPVLILKLGHYVIHHGAVGVARTLGRRGVPVFAVVEDVLTPLACSRHVSDTLVWPSSAAGGTPSALLDDLREFAQRLRTRAIIIPTDDAAAAFAAEHQDVLAQWFIQPRIAAGLPRLLSNKRELHFLCRKNGIPCPDGEFPSSLQDVLRAIETLRFPIVVKAIERDLLPKGASTVVIATNAQELIAAFLTANTPGYPNLMFQEYIPEAHSEDWIFHGYCNPDRDLFVAFTGKKLRSWPPFAGPTTLGVPVRNEALIQQTNALLRAIRYAGIMDLDYRFDKRDGQYKLLDFNPRIGANFRMFEDRTGLDVVGALHRDLTGRSVRELMMADDFRTFVVEPYDLLASIGYMRHGGLTARTWRNSLKGKKERAWFTTDDPMPFFVMCVRLLIRTLGKAFRISRSKLWDKTPDTQSPRLAEKL